MLRLCRRNVECGPECWDFCGWAPNYARVNLSPRTIADGFIFGAWAASWRVLLRGGIGIGAWVSKHTVKRILNFCHSRESNPRSLTKRYGKDTVEQAAHNLKKTLKRGPDAQSVCVWAYPVALLVDMFRGPRRVDSDNLTQTKSAWLHSSQVKVMFFWVMIETQVRSQILTQNLSEQIWVQSCEN